MYTNELINHFFEFLNARIKFVREDCLGTIEGMILLTCYLDALAGYRYGRNDRGKKFGKFLIHYSGAKDTWTKISLVNLYDRLFKDQDAECKQLAESVFSKHRLGNFINFDGTFNPDCDRATLMEGLSLQLSKNTLTRLEKVVSRFEYSSILWHYYRGDSVHETLLPGPFPTDNGPFDAPHYSTEGVMRDDNWVTAVKFHLPFEYILETVEVCLRQFKRECESGEFDFARHVAPRLLTTTGENLIVILPPLS